MKRLIAAALLALAPMAGWAEGMHHKIAFQVNSNDPQTMNIALNNVENVVSYYEEQGDTVDIEIVAYGPGLNMYIPGKSPVEKRIQTMALGMENVKFAACGNTHRKMSKKAGKDIPIMEEATMVTSGVVRLTELQEQGFAYVKP